MLQLPPPSSRRRQEHLGQEACRLQLQQSFRELPEALLQSVLLLTLQTQVRTLGVCSRAYSWLPASTLQVDWQHRAHGSDGNRLTKANFVRRDCAFLALRCAYEA